MNWIKIAADMKADDAMGAIADECGVARYAAVGLCVNVLGVMANKAQSGDLATVRDSTLEEWAGWDGKRGRFAMAFRTAMCTEAGMVRSWEKYNGAAIRKAEADIERLRAKRRQNVARRSQDGPASVGVVSQVDGDGDEKKLLLCETQEVVDTTPALTEASPIPSEVRAWVAPRGHPALASLLAAVPDATAWIGILRGLASGLSMDHGRPCDPARLATALEDFVAKDKHREAGGPSPTLFRSFVQRAKAPTVHGSRHKTPEEHMADDLVTIRRQNERRARCGEPLHPEPAWAPRIDAMFPDGRTYPVGAAA